MKGKTNGSNPRTITLRLHDSVRPDDCLAANGQTDARIEFLSVTDGRVSLNLWSACVLINPMSKAIPPTGVTAGRRHALGLEMCRKSEVAVGFQNRAKQPRIAQITVLTVYQKKPGVRLHIKIMPRVRN
jgi:hypothetical protein